MEARNLMAPVAALLLAVGTWGGTALAQDAKADEAKSKAQTLDQLLGETRAARQKESRENAEREKRFLAQRNEQASMLSRARGELAAQEARSRVLSAKFDANEKHLVELQSVLDAKGGNLGELFGMVRQSAGDAAGIFLGSPATARMPEREAVVGKLAGAKALPNIDELEGLWFELQREMTETGRIAKFQANVVQPDGETTLETVTSVGPFTSVYDGQFVNYLPTEKSFAILSRQPQGRYLSMAEDLEDADEGYVNAVVDPTRGALLAVLVQRPNIIQTIQYGGLVGYLIIGLGLWGMTLAGLRFVFLRGEDSKISVQRKNIGQLTNDNPLGRVLKVYDDDPKADKETVQLRLDEAVLKEIPPLEAGLPMIKIFAAVGPLAGLLGTVTGMILTFQQITLFGTGDPKIMAEGISQALVTTVLGLCVAIPLVLIHSYLHSKSRAMVQILEEESAGLVAEHAEKVGSV